ncbi:LpqB family beta-propeller domain-containing protein [Marinactinospora rubrisoli]|uniref:Lipoprotein LpqB n=1 Tax=Marinactinospora rubrisoli TaxID=2715399 RepID=A0ABW2KE68_9ACTN
MTPVISVIRTRRLAALGAAASTCLLAALSGCATVPTGGPVVQNAGGENAAEQDGTYVRLLPAGPQPGVGEIGLIRGFLKDMGSFEENHRAARLYMTSAEQSAWSPDGTVLVYGELDSVGLDVTPDESGQRATVHMRTPQVATIEPSGQYVPAGAGEVIDITFELARVNGEWRISDLPSDLVLSRRDVDRVFRPLNLYYFNRDMSTLVPDPVFLPANTSQLPTQLVKMLVSGPTDWLRPAVRSSFPAGTSVAAAFDSGRVTVELTTGSGSVTDAEFGMGAQLVWTLKQLPEVQELVLRVNGEEVELPGEEDENVQTGLAAWNSVNPAGVTDDVRGYFIRDGQLWSLDGEQQEARALGAAGRGDSPLELYAVSLDEDRVAGVTGDTVQAADLVENSDYRTVLHDGDYTGVSWDGYGNLWVVEDTTREREDEPEAGSTADDTERGNASPSPQPSTPPRGGTRVWLAPDGADPVEVSAPELADREVVQLRASRDGTRVAVLTRDGDDTQVWVGRVVHGDDGVAVQEFIPLASDLNQVADITWRGADQLAVLGQKDRGAMQAYLVPLDGSTESTSAGATPGADMRTIAAAPGAPLLSGVENDNVWLTNDRLMWQRVTDGTNPVYPG